jgi:hypothetical protein
MKILALILAISVSAMGTAFAASTDDIANVLVDAGRKPITADSLPQDFARLAHFVRHEANGMILYTDSAPADGHVRNAQAHFDTIGGVRPPNDKLPLFSVAFELVDQPDFTFDGLASAIERKLGTPTASSNRNGAVFRTWLLKEPAGRSFTVARAQATDNGDPIIIVQLLQAR